MSADASGVRYAVVHEQGHFMSPGIDSLDRAFDWRDQYGKGCSVVALTPVPRPVERPTAVIGGKIHRVQALMVQVWQPDGWKRAMLHETDSILAAAKLIADTERWEAERAAHASAEAGEMAPAFNPKWIASIRKAYPYLADHASHIDGEFANAVAEVVRWCSGAERRLARVLPKGVR